MTDNRTTHCCRGCYHYGHFIGHKGEICELDGNPRKRPNNYTNCGARIDVIE